MSDDNDHSSDKPLWITGRRVRQKNPAFGHTVVTLKQDPSREQDWHFWRHTIQQSQTHWHKHKNTTHLEHAETHFHPCTWLHHHSKPLTLLSRINYVTSEFVMNAWTDKAPHTKDVEIWHLTVKYQYFDHVRGTAPRHNQKYSWYFHWLSVRLYKMFDFDIG